MIHLADCISIDPQNRSKIHENMIELIVTLIRNLVKIPDLESSRTSINEFKRNLQYNLLMVFSKDSVFDALIYLCQDMNSLMMKKLNLVFLEKNSSFVSDRLEQSSQIRSMIRRSGLRSYHANEFDFTSVDTRESR